MSKKSDNYAALAAAAGLYYDGPNNVIYGKKAGFDLLVYAADPKIPYVLTIHTSARGTLAAAASRAEVKELTGRAKAISVMQQQGNNIIVSLKGTNNQEKMRQWLSEAVNVLVSFLQEKGYEPCCSICGQTAEISGFRAGADYMHLCPECEGRVRGNYLNQAQKQKAKKENVVGGIVGALLGSLLGVLSIVLLSQLGYVAALSGVIMAVGVLKGYELLGGKLTKKGIVIGVIVMLIMTYVGDRVDWAILVSKELSYYNVTVFDCYRAIPGLVAEGDIDLTSYVGNLVLLYVFLLLGAVPTVISSAKEQRTQAQLAKIGNGSFLQ